MERRKLPFHAIIIGGSVSGLTLAHTFSAANISYTLLEARDTISPQVGASIVIFPNGARILDQLGVYEKMEKEVMTPMKRSFVRRGEAEDGEGGAKAGAVLAVTEWPKLVHKMMGYMCGVCERMNFLRSLYDQLEDKSAIRLSKKAVEIIHEQDVVTVKCADGTEFRGDIVIGGDGIHSKTRQAMQKFIEGSGHAELLTKDKNCITASYSCIYGIATGMTNFSPGDGHISSCIDYSALLFIGKGNIPQWFFFSKLPEPIIGQTDIPRFSKQDLDAQIAKYEDYHVTDEITVGDLMAKTTTVGLFPVEEANHDVWTYGRFVCIGDAIHKMTPNFGQGGNQAIESAAVLTNCLLDMLKQTPGQRPSLAAIEASLQKYQHLRQRRAKRFVDVSAIVTRVDSLATLGHTLRFLYMEPMSGEVLASIQINLYQAAPYLNFLPLPPKTLENELWNDGVERTKQRDATPKARL